MTTTTKQKTSTRKVPKRTKSNRTQPAKGRGGAGRGWRKARWLDIARKTAIPDSRNPFEVGPHERLAYRRRWVACFAPRPGVQVKWHVCGQWREFEMNKHTSLDTLLQSVHEGRVYVRKTSNL